MPTYGYIAVDRYGKRKKASMFADDPEHLKILVKHDGYILVEYKEQGIMSKDIDLPFTNKVKDRDLSVFCRQFVSIIAAGVPISDALQLLSIQTENKRLKKAIADCRLEIEKGETFSESLKKQGSDIFPDIMISMTKAGEASGNLEIAFKRLADYFESRNRTISAVKRAMIYPSFIVALIVAAVIFMMTFVLPQFKDIFENAGADLPGVTRVLMAISDWLVEYWWLAILIVIAIVVALKLFGKTSLGKHIYGKLAIKAPIFGKMKVKTESALFARTCSTLLSAGLPLIDTLDICADNLNNIYFKESIQRAKTEVSVGTPLASGVEMGASFPPLVSHMIGIGEETGDLENMLDRIAQYYDEETEHMIASLMSLLEPLILLVMALGVVFIVFAVLLPMFEMYGHIA